MKYWWMILLCSLAACVLPGCDRTERHPASSRTDIVDRDFAAFIAKTDDPFAFWIEIRKVNPKADKKIGGLCCVVDLALRDSSGKRYAADYGEGRKHGREVTEVFEWPKPSADFVKGKVRLLRGALPPGSYTVEPRMRIVEAGEDRVSGPYADMGSVAVPAGNSVKVRLSEHWLVKPVRDPGDVADRDFVATIGSTKTPYVYSIEVKRVNNKVDKSINPYSEVFADLELVDSRGRTIAGDFGIQTFAEYVGDGFQGGDLTPPLTYVKGRVRLLTSGLSAGTYRVRPVVRIPEDGKDALSNPRADFGTVAVPAGNSVTVVIK